MIEYDSSIIKVKNSTVIMKINKENSTVMEKDIIINLKIISRKKVILCDRTHRINPGAEEKN